MTINSALYYITIAWLVLIALDKIARISERTNVKISPFFLRVEFSANFLKRIPGRSLESLSSRIATVCSLIVLLTGFGALAYLSNSLVRAIGGTHEPPSVIPVIPGVTVGLSLPILTSIFLVVVVHELGHAVVALKEGIPVRKIAFFLLYVIPGALVETDDEKTKEAGPRKRIVMESAGILSNFGLGIVVALIAIVVFPGFPWSPQGVYVSNVLSNGPSAGKLMPGDVIISINGSKVRSIADLINTERRLRPGSLVLVSTLRGNVTVVLGSSPKNASLPWFGIYLNPFPYYGSPLLPSSASMLLEEFILWIILFTFGIGVLNALPLVPLDGGLVLKDSLRLLISDENFADKVAKAISIAAGFVLISNIVYSIIQMI